MRCSAERGVHVCTGGDYPAHEWSVGKNLTQSRRRLRILLARFRLSRERLSFYPLAMHVSYNIMRRRVLSLLCSLERKTGDKRAVCS